MQSFKKISGKEGNALDNENTVKKESNSIKYLLVLNDILKGWYFIIIAAIIASMATYAYITETYEPVYNTKVTFVVSSKNNNSTVLTNLSVAANLAKVFTNVVNSAVMKNEIVKEVGEQARSASIEAQVIDETNLLRVQVKAGDPIVSFKVAKTLVEKHGAVTGEILENAIFEVLQKPEVPVSPTNGMGRAAAVRKWALIAAAAVAVILAIKSYTSGTIKDEKDFSDKINARLLATMYHENKYKTLKSKIFRKKTGLLVTNPFVSFGYAETVKAFRAKVEYQATKHSAKVIMVSSVLENEGKSTVAANLAITLAQKGKKTLLIDCDLRKPSVYKLFHLSMEKDNRYILKNTTYGLNLLAVKNTSSKVIEQALSSSLKGIIDKAREKYDYIIIDTPPMSVAADSERMTAYCDASILVVRFNYAKANDVSDAVELLKDGEAKFLGCVFNDAFVLGVNIVQRGYGSYGYGYGSYGSYGSYGASQTEKRKKNSV